MAMLRVGADRRTVAIDGSSRAPNRLEPGRFTRSDLLSGHVASTVPSTPAVLAYLAERYGKLPLARLLEPAIRLAEEGYEVSDLQAALARREAGALRAGSARRFFLKENGRPYPAGARFRQEVLARTLRRLAKHGVEDFYQGEIARKIHRDMERNHGLIREDDLARVPLPIERKPLRGVFRELKVATMPPPGAGRTLIETLNILGEFPRLDIDTPEGALLLARVLRHVGIDRRDRPFEPDLYPQVVEHKMTDMEYARRTAAALKRGLRSRGGSGETTHLSAMDVEGNAVALTQSIERVYGSREAAPDLGFLYNNYMLDFEYEDASHPYYLRPNAVPWSTVVPTIVVKGRTPWLVIGSPGSERITSAVVQVLLRLFRQKAPDAVAAPRLHCSVHGKVSLEATRMRDDAVAALGRAGFEIDVRNPYSFYLGCVQMVLHEGGGFLGVADPRRDGSAGGRHR
jgi:gamma-glutamyltranspeptidase/glutathione hydrolase